MISHGTRATIRCRRRRAGGYTLSGARFASPSHGIHSSYGSWFDYEAAKGQTDIFRFQNADMEWLNFVVGNRRGEELFKAADMHIGPVADDNVYRSIRLFETGVLDAGETVKRLKTEVLQDQWTFRSEKILSFLTFIEAKEIRKES